jgi:hypothetical protein
MMANFFLFVELLKKSNHIFFIECFFRFLKFFSTEQKCPHLPTGLAFFGIAEIKNIFLLNGMSSFGDLGRFFETA